MTPWKESLNPDGEVEESALTGGEKQALAYFALGGRFSDRPSPSDSSERVRVDGMLGRAVIRFADRAISMPGAMK